MKEKIYLNLGYCNPDVIDYEECETLAEAERLRKRYGLPKESIVRKRKC